MNDEIEIPADEWVPGKLSTEFRRQLRDSDGPLRLLSLGAPDEDGFYTPAFMVIGWPE